MRLNSKIRYQIKPKLLVNLIFKKIKPNFFSGLSVKKTTKNKQLSDYQVFEIYFFHINSIKTSVHNK